MGGCLFGMGHCCSTSFPDVLHWSVSNLVLASWQSWLPSGINYASMWFISVGSSTQHSSLPNPIGSTSVAQPLQLSPNQIYWVCVASVSRCLHAPRAISPICPRQFHYIRCSKVLPCKECTVLHHSCLEARCVQCRASKPHSNSSSCMRSWFWKQDKLILLLKMLWAITELFFFIGISLLKQDAWSFVEAVWSAWWPLSVRVHLDTQSSVQDELYGQATMGQHYQQLIPGLHSLWRKCPEPPVPSMFWGPGDPQEETVHGHPEGLGPRPWEPQYGAQSQFDPSEMALTGYCLQVETDPDREAEEETLWCWGRITG